MKDLIKTKTFWTGIIGLISAAAGAATGSMDAGQAVQLAVSSLLGIFIRDGIRKGQI